jgi:hypothetical protein
MALTRDLCCLNRGAFWCSEEVFQRNSWLPGGGCLTAPVPGLTAPSGQLAFELLKDQMATREGGSE